MYLGMYLGPNPRPRLTGALPFQASMLEGLGQTILDRFGASLGALWGPSWGHVGLSWGHLGPCWGQLGAILGHLGAILGHLGAILAILGPSSALLGVNF